MEVHVIYKLINIYKLVYFVIFRNADFNNLLTSAQTITRNLHAIKLCIDVLHAL
jgi:hypothetical protein